MLTIISYNVAHRWEAWRALRETGADVALLQEACAPPEELSEWVAHDPGHWRTGCGLRPWRTCVAKLNREIEFRHYPATPLDGAEYGELPVSTFGTLAAADVTDPETSQVITVVSMYAKWEHTHASRGPGFEYADAAAHRLISDLSAFVTGGDDHSIIAAGDLNILFGYGENRSVYWARRYQTVFDRMEALGLTFVGPQYPNGRRADPPPSELPEESKNVPTFYTNRSTPATATRQLDYVFASESIAHRVKVRALNECAEWGPSDHCMVRIEVGG